MDRGECIENWHAKRRPPKTVTQGSYCSLVPLDPSKHAPNLFEAFQIDPQGTLWTYLPYGPFSDYNEFQKWLISLSMTEDPLFYTITDAKTELPLGLASYMRITPEHGVVEVGHIIFSNLLKQTTAATEAMYLMMKRAFDELNYRRYEWKCDALNLPSIAAAKRLGFTFEGIFRQDKVVKGRNRDTAWFSIIDKEWPQIKSHFQIWLDPNNFDQNGHQMTKLREIKSLVI